MTSDEPGDPGTRRSGNRILAIISIIVLVAGLAILAVFATKNIRERTQIADTAEMRDTATDAASEVIVNAFSFHYDTVEDSLQKLEDSSTGNFLAEQQQWSEDVQQRVEEQQAVTETSVSNTALSALDTNQRAASVIVVFTATSQREGEEDITGRQAMRVDLVWEDDQWKATEVAQVGVTVPVGESSAAVEELDGMVAPEGGGGEGGAGGGDGGGEGSGSGSADDGGSGADDAENSDNDNSGDTSPNNGE